MRAVDWETLSFISEDVVISGTGCWQWNGLLSSRGYAKKWLPKYRKAWWLHRWMYEHFRGELLPDMELDHLCQTPNCVNPDHLEQVTHAENMRRRPVKRGPVPKTVCKNGHEFTEDNTRWSLSRGTLYKQCKECSRQNLRKSRALKRATAVSPSMSRRTD